MAEGFLRKYAGEIFAVHSAGTDPAERINPLAIEVMAERGIDISGQEPKPVSNFLGRLLVRHLIIVCDGANEKCPRTFPNVLNRLFWPIDDPATFVGSPSAMRDKFREVRRPD